MGKLISLFSALCLMFNLCGCTSADIQNTADTKQSEIQTIQTNTPAEEPQQAQENNISEQGSMRVHFIDVEQGDSIFIELPNGETMLIDAAESYKAATIIGYIQSLNYTDIDYVVATHPHEDHIGGMAEVLNNFNIGKMYMPGQAHTTKTFENLLNTIESKNIDLYRAKAGETITESGNLKIDILAPLQEIYSNLNNCSAVVKITYGKTVFLFTGDAEKQIETQLLSSGIQADVLKVGHHGAGSSSDTSFIRAVSPSVAVISCGKNNSYGHPHSDTLAILNEVGANVYRTDEVGTVVVTADSNKKISVDKKASSIQENAPPENITSTESETNTAASDNQTAVVYRTKSGTKYHSDGCSYLKSKIQTTVEEAKAMGLTPCSRCNPPQ